MEYKKIRLLVIVVTYNAMKWADRCLGSLKTSSVPSDVFVVDNGSTDGTQDYIKMKYPEIIFHQSSENLGFGKANNIGLQYALDNGCDYVYLLNQDAWVMPDTFEKMISAHNQNPEYGILSPIQMQANMNHVDKNFLQNFGYQGVASLEKLFLAGGRGIVEVKMTMAAHWLISKECFNKVGGFSPAFPHYGEDNNYADRVIYHGFKNGIVLDAKGVHDRAQRVSTPDQLIYSNYVRTIQNLTSLNDNVKNPVISFYYHSLRNVITYRSLKPFRYVVRLQKELRTIARAKESSKVPGAFLNS